MPAPDPAPVRIPDPDARLQRARTIDWRFALPDPTPGTVAFVGAIDPDLPAAFDDAGWQSASSGADLAVIDGPSPADLAAAALAVRPGGWIYVACRGPAGATVRRRRLAPAAVAARLAALGFGSFRMQLHVPGFGGRDAIVPLDETAALALLLRRRGGLAGSRPVVVLARWLVRSGWLARLAPAVSVVAQRGLDSGDAAGARDAISSHLDMLRSSDPGLPIPTATSAPLLLTPRFRASRHVVGLVPDPRGWRVELVAKVARLPDSGEVTRREGAALDLLAGRRGAARHATAPRLVAVGAPWGLPSIIETAVEGRPIDPAAVRHDPDATIDAVVDWLADLAGATGTAAPRSEPAADRLARLLDAPLDAFATALPLTDDERELVARTRALAEPLRTVLMHVVLEHGDASHPNLVRRRDGGVGAVDWELAEPDGLPAHDLTTFLAYVATALASARTPSEQGAAIATALTDPDGWARAAARDYAARVDLDESCLDPLTAIALARLTVGLVERLHDGAPTAVAPATVEWLRGHRYLAAWRAVVAAQTADGTADPGTRP